MIRDEFIKQQNEANLSPKEMDKIRKVGERVFYTTEINKIINYSKVFNFSFIIVAVMVLIILVPIILAYFVEGFSTNLLLYTLIVAFFLIIVLGWFLIFRPRGKKKIAKYKAELERLREIDLQKQRIIFKNYIK